MWRNDSIVEIVMEGMKENKNTVGRESVSYVYQIILDINVKYHNFRITMTNGVPWRADINHPRGC